MSQIAVVTIDNPPVNAMSIGVPKDIMDAIETLNADAGVAGILLKAGGNGISGGADIKTQGKAWPSDQPKVTDLIRLLDRSEKPVGFLIQNATLGAGLEIAMGCRFRISTPAGKVGQPEVKIGIPPGAGGTQFLPRLVGAKTAMDMILSGNPARAEDVAQTGLIDRMVSADNAVAEAVSFMAGEIDAGRVPPRTSERDVQVDDPDVFETARETAAKKFRGRTAPFVCIDCVEIATKTPIAEGLAYERKRFLECVGSEEAASLRHVFFAERQARKVPGIGKDSALRVIDSAVVLGAGTMGAGIAICIAGAGIPVTIVEKNEEALQRGSKRIADTFAGQVQKGRISADEADRRTKLVSFDMSMEAVATADIVIEAVFEDMDVKKSIFADLAQKAKPGAILATNTSYLDVNEIAAATDGREADVLGLHFFSPANIMKLLEVVRGDKTADEVLVSGLKFGERIGKTAVVSGVCHGFIGNRVFAKYNREAEFLLQEGATAVQVDTVLKQFGMAMGPFAVRDLAGLDIGWAMRKSTAHLRNPGERYSRVGDLICEQGWFGQKTGKGFYVYENGKPTPNPDLQAIIDETAREAGIVTDTVSDDTVIERCLYAMVNECAKVLEEGIALRASDIDLVFINGYGFPGWRGGPLHWADTVGLAKVLAAIVYFNEGHDFWEPAPLLQRLVQEGKTFADWDREKAA
ncbi:MAG: 3-hydroxyacyl-CoA dehydrogenase NAD-binding domain-containing protein [Alphaproteobacteria bacterium]